jgi:hypothetical protein
LTLLSSARLDFNEPLSGKNRETFNRTTNMEIRFACQAARSFLAAAFGDVS